MANRQIDPDTYNVGFADAEQGAPYNPPFSNPADIAQYRSGYANGLQSEYDEPAADRGEGA